MSEWKSIETAPKQGKIDLWAKMWAPAFDEFVYRRFPDCFWLAPDFMTNRRGEWVGVSDGWRATHWMPVPEGPQAAPAGATPVEQGAPESARDSSLKAVR